MHSFLRIALAVTFLAFAGSAPALADSCSDLAKLSLPDTKITTAETVAAGKFQPPKAPGGLAPGVAPTSYDKMPAFCRVAATLTPTSDSDIKIEVWMPAEHWNGKFVGIGNGVWAGSISLSQMVDPLSRGYAVASTDTGHTGNGMDAGFVVGHPEKLVDFGYRAVHEMTVKAKALVKAYYSKGPELSFWTSCSTGGRQGLMEAYRFPEDYDGISAMAPANPMTNLMTQSIWTGYAAMKSPEHALSRTKLAAVHNRWIEACDDADGLKDGLVTAPDHCNFDPKVAECKGADGPDCLTAAQVETMRQVYGGVVDPQTGKTIFPGFEPGSENQVGILMSGPQPFPVATTYMADVVFKNPKWDFKTFDYHKDVEAARKAGEDILDVPTDGLSKFFAAGHKLLLSHGWSDGLIPSMNTVNFYEAAKSHLNAKAAEDQLRLFMIPTMGHCGGGDAPTVFDPLMVVESWVETGKAPDRIVAHRPPNAPPMTRPLCPYPEIAKYTGKGATEDAANFVCGKAGS